MSTANATVMGRLQEVSAIMRPHHGTAKWDRLSAFIKKESGGKNLADTLSDASIPEDKKLKLLDDIERIAKGELWDECPAPPNGQADAGPAKPKPAAPAPAPKPAAVAAPAKPALPPELQHPKIEIVSVGASTPPAPPVVPPAVDPMAALAAALVPHLLPLIKPHLPTGSTAAPLDEKAVAKVVDSRLAIVLHAVANGITAST